MQSNSNEEQSDESVPENPLVRVLLALRRSLILDFIVIGVLLVAIGASPLLSGVYAGMFGVWGVTALLCAVLGYVALKALKLFDADD